ncbi:hypothetical protein CTA1_11495 [Colletotrichum tanaceti]|uniref:Uncharacterized protein n=1 Tax=Colletotrichum tanaceti TaxID=1306861 RepID=A0A4U6XU70_9PEZI|nr:hypothetical protein CTA1_11495 [Colletotrichum tanaceti]
MARLTIRDSEAAHIRGQLEKASHASSAEIRDQWRGLYRHWEYRRQNPRSGVGVNDASNNNNNKTDGGQGGYSK